MLQKWSPEVVLQNKYSNIFRKVSTKVSMLMKAVQQKTKDSNVYFTLIEVFFTKMCFANFDNKGLL